MADKPKADEPKSKVNDKQIERMEAVVRALATRGNPLGQGLTKSLDEKKSIEDKRNVLLGGYAQIYEAMVCLQMAINSDKSADEIARSLSA